MFNYNKANTTLSAISDSIKSQTESRNNGIKDCLVNIESKLLELNKEGLIGRKARKSAKESILGNIGTISKELNRAYSIAFTMVFREVKIHTEVLTVAQVENLSKYGTTNEINELYELDLEVYCSEVSAYLKSLKTRVVETKTFEKLSNKR